MSLDRVFEPLHAALRHLPLPGMGDDFMHAVLLGALIVAPMCAALGVQVVTFRMAFFSDAVAHSAYTGVALGILAAGAGASVGVTLAMMGFGVLVGLGVAALREHTRQTPDTIIGIVFSAVVALGLVVVALASDRGLSATMAPFLFGDVINLTAGDVLFLGLLALPVFAFQIVGYNRLLLIGLNPVLARARGIRTGVWGALFATLLALVVTGSVRTIGVLVVGGLLVAPAAAARNVARSAGGMFWWALVFATVSAVAGVELAFVLKRPPTGPAIILCATAIYGLSEIYRAVRKR
jgi:zinc transport system permease protein